MSRGTGGPGLSRVDNIRDGVVRVQEPTIIGGDPHTLTRYNLPNGYTVSVVQRNGERHDYSVTVWVTDMSEPDVPAERVQSAFNHTGILLDGVRFGRGTWQQVEAFIDRVRGW